MKNFTILLLLSLSHFIYGQEECFHEPVEFNENCSPIFCIYQNSDSCAVFLKSFDLLDFYGSVYSIQYDSIVPYYSALYEIANGATKRVSETGEFNYRMTIYFEKDEKWVEYEGNIQVFRSETGYKSAIDYPYLKKHKASPISSVDYRFEESIAAYQASENWTIWSLPFYEISAAITSYTSTDLKNMTDKNLETAWIGELNHSFTITVNYEKNTFYGSAYNFYGAINIFNGNCRSLALWNQCARIKTLKIALNEQNIGLIELEDTWQLQTVDIGSYFKNKYGNKYLDAAYELKNGDQLSFEILAIYPGSRFDMVACSEFLMEGAKN